MPNLNTKTANNPFYRARVAASKHNESLCSREGAADTMCIDRGRLYRIESGIVKPYPEEVHMMADLYNAPELRNQFCREMCPLGECYAKADAKEVDRVAVMAMSALSKADNLKERFLAIAEDGEISEDEREDMIAIVEGFEKLEAVSQNVKNLMKRTLG